MEKTLELSTCELDGHRLEIEFAWASDRFRHRVILSDQSGPLDLLTSVEGTDEVWPHSPALQQVSHQQTGLHQDFAACVGMAGDSHWSLSAMPNREGQVIHFDVACRVKRPPTWLGSTYQLGSEHDFAQNENGVEIFLGRHVVRVAATPQDECTHVQVNDGQVRVRVQGEATTFPHTFRWRYSVSFTRLSAGTPGTP